jgi:hypothetical protein
MPSELPLTRLKQIGYHIYEQVCGAKNDHGGKAMNKTAAVFGAIWGVFALIFSLFLFLVIFAPDTALSSDFAPFGNSVLLYFNGSSFEAGAWAIAAGAFGLGALGLIGAGIVRQRHIAAGVFLLISTVGMLLVCFQSFLVGEYSVLDDFTGFFEFGPPEQIFIVTLTVLITLLGFLGSLFSLAAKPKLSRPQPIPQPQPIAAQPVAPTAVTVPAEPVAPVEAEPAVPVAAEPAAEPAEAKPAQPGDGAAE